MATPGNMFNVPHFLKAGSPEGLRLKMLENNVVMKAECQYFQIVHDGKEWTAWFYRIAPESRMLNKRGGK